MNTRIREIRNYLGLTQTEFGKRIGLSRPMVANLEGEGRAEIKDHVIHLICKEFNVNEEWLRSGSGEMFKQKTVTEELVELTDKLLSEEPTIENPDAPEFLTAFAEENGIKISCSTKTGIKNSISKFLCYF